MKRALRSPVLKVFLAFALFLPVASLTATPASANHPKTTFGDFKFTATSVFTMFPCATSCNALIKGSWTEASLKGRVGNEPFAVKWGTTPTTEKFHMQFTTFEEFCELTDAGWVAMGYADGTVTATASGDLEVTGFVNGTTKITSVSMVARFGWTRTGNSALINFREITVTLNRQTGNPLVAVDMPQAGSAVFSPTNAGDTDLNDPPPDNLPPSCEEPMTNVTGVVEGDGSFMVDPPA